MKRRDLLQYLNQQGCQLVRDSPVSEYDSAIAPLRKAPSDDLP